MRNNPLFSRTRAETIAAVGERRLIELVRGWLGPATPPSPWGIGDDAAVLPAGRGLGLITVDPVVFGVHFDSGVGPADAGRKLLRRNLSDIAAMGGSPRAAVLSLATDGSVRLAWLRAFYRAIARDARAHGVCVVGGDVARAPGVFVATLTLTGAAGARFVPRAGARLGDSIYVTGRLGRSLASGRHFRFRPRLAEGAWLAGRPAVHAMMDLSDGLAKDLPCLCPPGAGMAVDGAALPLAQGGSVREALCDGEDYELLFCAASGAAGRRLERAWARAFPRTLLSRIGEVVPRGKTPPGALDLALFRGYEHHRDA